MNKTKTFIISYNRLEFLKKQLEFLMQIPELELIVVDNNSQYPPLLEYLHYLVGIDIKVITAQKNHGHTVVWDLGLSRELCPHQPYIVSDCDILPNKKDFLSLLLNGLDKFPKCNKVGLGLDKHDIPNVPFRQEIINHENSLFNLPTQDLQFNRVAVDTTLAIYRAGYHNSSVWGYENNDNQYHVLKGCLSIRTTYPWSAKHLSWYMTLEDIQKEEYQFYFKNLKPYCGHWSGLQAKLK